MPLDVSGKLTKQKVVFTFHETGPPGGGPRGIDVDGGGASLRFNTNPNPHGNPAYNGGKQAHFYRAACDAIIKDFVNPGEVLISKTSQQPPTYSGTGNKAWTRLTMKEQHSWIRKYNEQQKKEGTGVQKQQLEAAVKKLNCPRKFKWFKVEYKLTPKS